MMGDHTLRWEGRYANSVCYTGKIAWPNGIKFGKAYYSQHNVLEEGKAIWQLLPKSKYEMMRTNAVRKVEFCAFRLFHIFPVPL